MAKKAKKVKRGPQDATLRNTRNKASKRGVIALVRSLDKRMRKLEKATGSVKSDRRMVQKLQKSFNKLASKL